MVSKTGGAKKSTPKKSSKKMPMRNFKIVEVDGKAMEFGIYHSRTTSGAAAKAFTQICRQMSKNKKCKHTFSIKETTNDSAKKIYGPYVGERVKLSKPIELNGRTIEYKHVVHRSKKQNK